MKDTRFLYGVAILAVISILACLVIGYATDTFTMHRPKQALGTTTTPKATVKKKNCECCDEKIRQLHQKIQKAREVQEREQVKQ